MFFAQRESAFDASVGLVFSAAVVLLTVNARQGRNAQRSEQGEGSDGRSSAVHGQNAPLRHGLLQHTHPHLCFAWDLAP
jgi:hypothetical protein